jgi:hypothetical protein
MKAMSPPATTPRGLAICINHEDVAPQYPVIDEKTKKRRKRTDRKRKPKTSRSPSHRSSSKKPQEPGEAKMKRKPRRRPQVESLTKRPKSSVARRSDASLVSGLASCNSSTSSRRSISSSISRLSASSASNRGEMRYIIECIRTDRQQIVERSCTSAKMQADFNEQRRNILMKWEIMNARRKARNTPKGKQVATKQH